MMDDHNYSDDEEPQASGSANGMEPETVDNEDEVPDDSFHCFTGHSNSVFCVAWSPSDELIVASGGQDDTGCLWKTWIPDSEMEELPCEFLEGHSDSIIDIRFSYNGDLLATGAMDGLVKIWNKDGSLLRTLEGPTDSIIWIDWHPRGNVILAGSADFSTWMWNSQTGACMQVFTGHGDGVSCGKFSAGGRSVITCGAEGDPSLKIWNPRNGECTTTISGFHFHQTGITCLDINSEASLSVTGSSDCTVRICNLSAGQTTGTLAGHSDSVECVSFVEAILPVIMTGALDGKLISWDRNTFAQRHTYQHPEGVVCVRVSSRTPLMAVGSLDGMIRLWDTRMSTLVREMHGFSAAVQCLEISPNEMMIMAGSDDSTVRIFDIRQNSS